MSIYKGTTPLAGIVTPHLDTRNVGQIIQSTLPLTDAGLHLLDGSLLSGDGIYSEFVTYIAQLVSSHPELFTTEANWQTSVTNYGVCGKFVYDSVNSTVRLPKISSNGRYLIYSYSNNSEFCRVYSDGWCEQGNSVYLGSNQGYKSFDITFYREMANAEYRIHVNSDFSGSTSDGTNYWSTRTTTGVQIKTCGYGYSWSIAGYTDISDLKKETIYQYIVIANSTKTEIEVDIDKIATDLNGKVDKSSLDEVQCVVETYNNGTSWYRVWSDGWCEQGGTYYKGSSIAGDNTINFLKQFVNTNYNFIAFPVHSTANVQAYTLYEKYPSRTTSSTVLRCASALFGYSWEANGYIK